MDITWLGQLGYALPLAIAAAGSGLGIGSAGTAAAGAWAKEAKEGKPMEFKYMALIGMPLSQTLYGFLFMFISYKTLDPQILAAFPGTIFSLGLACGLGQLFSAWWQGHIGAAGIRAMSESEGKPFANILIAMGIAETVGIFAFVFCMLLMPNEESLKILNEAKAAIENLPLK